MAQALGPIGRSAATPAHRGARRTAIRSSRRRRCRRCAESRASTTAWWPCRWSLTATPSCAANAVVTIGDVASTRAGAVGAGLGAERLVADGAQEGRLGAGRDRGPGLGRRRPGCRHAATNDTSPFVRSLAQVAIPSSSSRAFRRSARGRHSAAGRRFQFDPDLIQSKAPVCVPPHRAVSLDWAAPSQRGCGAPRRLLDQARRRAALLRNHIQPIFNSFCVGNTSPCHSWRSTRRPERHGARQPGSLVVRGGPEAARRAAHLRQLSAAAAAAEGAAR